MSNKKSTISNKKSIQKSTSTETKKQAPIKNQLNSTKKTNIKSNQENIEQRKNDSKKDMVILAHGAGGSMQEQLIEFLTKGIKHRKVNDGIGLDDWDDSATIPLHNCPDEIVVTSDGHTVKPIFFPGGDLGYLSATGTLNDLLMMGAKPIAMMSTVFIEEGMDFDTLGKIFNSFNTTLDKYNVSLIGGDTKVLPKGNLDQIIMATTGIGFRPKSVKIGDLNLKVGQKIILTGSIGDHGATLIAHRNEIKLETDLVSDVAPLFPLFEKIPNYEGISAMKDPTRGGIASALNDWASKNKVGIFLDEQQILIKREVKAICDILGINPFEIACEGRALIAVEQSKAEIVLKKIQASELGKDAHIIGEIVATNPGKVLMKTRYGGTRFIEMPMGEPIPRVC